MRPWARYKDCQPARDDYERDAYAEWRRLDAEVAEDIYLYRILPDQLYERGGHGFTSWDEFYGDYLRQMHDDEQSAGPGERAVVGITRPARRRAPMDECQRPGEPGPTGPAPAM